jgi:crotonobetainyl-CoA:carnitine CoA-transferase CaiB-like acyl-CoA transferase
MAAGGTQPSVLDGVTVIEYSHAPAGAKCGRLLAELGATVVLLEPPEGHPLRGVVDDGATAAHYFETLMAGKQSVVVEPGGTSVESDLIEAGDVFLTDYEDPPNDALATAVAGDSADLLFCSITPFGLEGDSPRPNATESVVQATTGVTATSGFPDGPPAVTAVPIAASMAAIVGCGSVLARLYEGSDAGRIDVSMQDAILPLMTTFLPEYFATEEPVGRSGNRHPLAAPWNTYRAADDWVYFIAWTDDHWERFLEMADRDDLAGDDRFASNQARQQHVEAVDGIVQDWIDGRTVAEVIEAAEEHGLTAAAISDVADTLADRNLEYRGMLTDSGGHRIAASPFVMSETPGRIRSPAPDVDEGNGVSR